MIHIENYFGHVKEVCNQLNLKDIEAIVFGLHCVRENGGRLFILGVGGSAANASHAVNDFRKICELEAYAPTDNISELTARTNDEGWDSVFSGWLKISKMNSNDAVLVFSVGGGSLENSVSVNLIKALQYAKECNSKIFGILGRDGGYAGRVADAKVIVPNIDLKHITPLTESFQAVIWHCLVSHPMLQVNRTKW